MHYNVTQRYCAAFSLLLFLLGGPGNLIRFPSSPQTPITLPQRGFMNYLVYKDHIIKGERYGRLHV